MTRTLELIALGLTLALAGCAVRVQGGAHAATGRDARAEGENNGQGPKTIAAGPVTPNKVDRPTSTGNADSGIKGTATAGPTTSTSKPAPTTGTTTTNPSDREEQPAVTELEDKPERGDKQPKIVKVLDTIGTPTLFQPAAATAFWVWRGETDKLWHVRTTSKDGSHVFRGRIGVVGGKADITVVDAKNELADRYVKRPQSVHFAFRTGHKFDGFDFQVEGGKCVYFKLLIDDKPATEVYVGKENKKLDYGRFRVCQGTGADAEKVSR